MKRLHGNSKWEEETLKIIKGVGGKCNKKDLMAEWTFL